MGAKKHVVDLSDEDRKTLGWFISTSERKSEDNTRARILLKADDGLTDSTISEHVGCHRKTVYNSRKSYAERGLAAIHRRKPDREYEHKLDGRAEAHLIRLACSESPEGHARWSLHLLADELGIEFVFIPPHSPTLNAIEPLWKSLKREISPEVYEDRDHLREFLTETFLRLSRRLSFAVDWIDTFLPDVQKLG